MSEQSAKAFAMPEVREIAGGLVLAMGMSELAHDLALSELSTLDTARIDYRTGHPALTVVRPQALEDSRHQAAFLGADLDHGDGTIPPKFIEIVDRQRTILDWNVKDLLSQNPDLVAPKLARLGFWALEPAVYTEILAFDYLVSGGLAGQEYVATDPRRQLKRPIEPFGKEDEAAIQEAIIRNPRRQPSKRPSQKGPIIRKGKHE